MVHLSKMGMICLQDSEWKATSLQNDIIMKCIKFWDTVSSWTNANNNNNVEKSITPIPAARNNIK